MQPGDKTNEQKFNARLKSAAGGSASPVKRAEAQVSHLAVIS